MREIDILDEQLRIVALDTMNGRSPAVSLRPRLLARLRAGRYDRMLAVGAAARPGGALAAHARRVTSTPEREALVRTLSQMLREARGPAPVVPVRARLDRAAIAAAAAPMEKVIARLQATGPVSARGMARLRRILADPDGPLFRHGRGDLGGRFGAALAAL